MLFIETVAFLEYNNWKQYKKEKCLIKLLLSYKKIITGSASTLSLMYIPKI